jgi:orotate phosphoribosyltransferase
MPTLPARIRHRARLSGRFVLRSGIVSETYFDKYQFEADPELLRDIALAMCRLVPEGTEALAGLEMGGIPIVTILSQVTGLPAAFIRKEPKEYRNLPLRRGNITQRQGLHPRRGRRFQRWRACGFARQAKGGWVGPDCRGLRY